MEAGWRIAVKVEECIIYNTGAMGEANSSYLLGDDPHWGARYFYTFYRSHY